MSMNGHFRSQKRVFLRKQQEEHKLGVILVTMSCVFVFCQSVKIIPDLYELIWCKDDTGTCDMSSFKIFMPISHLLVCINSATNFLIYYCQGEKFRRAWMETYGCFWCCCERRPESPPAAAVAGPSFYYNNTTRAHLLSRHRSSSTGSTVANGPRLVNQLTVDSCVNNGQSLGSQTTSTSLVSHSGQYSVNERQMGRNGIAHI